MAETGIKYDGEKPKIADFIYDFQEVFYEMEKIYEFGCKKYGRGNVFQVKNGKERFTNALMRHFLSEPDKDDETGIMHATHVAYNAMIRLWYILQEGKNISKGKEIDYKCGRDYKVYVTEKGVTVE